MQLQKQGGRKIVIKKTLGLILCKKPWLSLNSKHKIKCYTSIVAPLRKLCNYVNKCMKMKIMNKYLRTLYSVLIHFICHKWRRLMRIDVQNQCTSARHTDSEHNRRHSQEHRSNMHESECLWVVVWQLTVNVWSHVHPALGLEEAELYQRRLFNAESWRPANDVNSNTQRQPDTPMLISVQPIHT